MVRRRLAGHAAATLIAALCSACSPATPTATETTPTELPKHHEYMVPAAEAPAIRERLKANGYTEYSEASVCDGMTTFIVPYQTSNELIGVTGALGQYPNFGDGTIRFLGDTEVPDQCP